MKFCPPTMNLSFLLLLCSPFSIYAFVHVKPGFVKITHQNIYSTTENPAALDNPLLEQDDLPRFDRIEPKDLTPAVDIILENLDKDFDELEQKLIDSSSPKYEDVLPALERIEAQIDFTWGVAGHLNGVKNGDELRTAYEENQPKVIQAITKLSQSKAVYNALFSIEKQWGEEEDFSESSEFVVNQKRRSVTNSLRGMTLSGVGLEGEEKERFNEMRLRSADLSTKFSNNVLDATKEFSVTVDEASKVEGAPQSAKAMWANAHIMHIRQENDDKDIEDKQRVSELDPEAGPWRISLDMPSYIAAMTHLPDRSLREQIYRAQITRASESNEEKNNVALIYEILKIKNEMATMLGYDDYAELSLATKMAPSIDAVSEMSKLIAEKAIPAAKKELEEITNLAREKGGDEYKENNLPKLMPWDTTFWSERLKEDKYELTEEELRPYFALPAVLDGMFGLVKRIFGVEVREADGDAEVWHPDVRFFKVFDVTSDEHIASFYLDPFSRPENKRGGAWMDTCIGKSQALHRKIPVAYLTCNGSPPVGDKPSLMTFREVETLFHEFGHGLQHMLTTAVEGGVAGINGIEWDAVELPSQFMENWCYDRSTVYGFAKHWETGEPLPEDVFEKLKAQKTFNAGMMTCRQLYFGQLDLELHSGYNAEAGEKGEGESIFDVQQRIASIYTPHSLPLDEDRFLCSFSHIFAGGYSAGYYSYKWAEVMSADAFGAFEDVGLESDEVEHVGRRFRDTVLSLGGGLPPMEVFKRFRGREPRPEPLLRHNGLV